MSSCFDFDFDSGIWEPLSSLNMDSFSEGFFVGSSFLFTGCCVFCSFRAGSGFARFSTVFDLLICLPESGRLLSRLRPLFDYEKSERWLSVAAG